MKGSHLVDALAIAFRNNICIVGCIMEPSTLSFESDTEDWSGFGLMDPTLEEDISTPEEATAVREFVQAHNTASPVDAEEAARMSLNEDRIPCDGLLDKGERGTWMLWDVAIVMPQYQIAVLVLVDAIRALPQLDATPEQEARFGKKLELWKTLDKWDDIWHRLWESVYSVLIPHAAKEVCSLTFAT